MRGQERLPEDVRCLKDSQRQQLGEQRVKFSGPELAELIQLPESRE